MKASWQRKHWVRDPLEMQQSSQEPEHRRWSWIKELNSPGGSVWPWPCFHLDWKVLVIPRGTAQVSWALIMSLYIKWYSSPNPRLDVDNTPSSQNTGSAPLWFHWEITLQKQAQMSSQDPEGWGRLVLSLMTAQATEQDPVPKIKSIRCMWWCTPVMLAFGGIHELKNILLYKASSSPAWAIWDPVSK